jgi:peptidyl-prolyl cis-trans isomerase A (cyclophilin A)
MFALMKNLIVSFAPTAARPGAVQKRVPPFLHILGLCLLKAAMLAALVMAFAPADAAQRKSAPRPVAPLPVDTAPKVRIILATSQGNITVEVDREHAPLTAANFLRYVDQRRFDGTAFYRAMRLGTDEAGNGQGLIQGGTQNDPKRILKPVAHEPTTQTGLKHLTGALSMARWAPGTATGDFSILVSPLPALDADPTQPGDNAGYAVFGYVVDGLDVVRKIHAAPTSPILGEGHMKGQMLAPTIKILTARRAPNVQPPPVLPITSAR